jgi:hypothetical protein
VRMVSPGQGRCHARGTLAWHRALGRKSRGFLFGLERQSYLSDVVPVELRARALSMLGAVSRTGLFISPFLGAGAGHLWGLVR